MDVATAWSNWAVGVLGGIGAPISGTNYTSLWNWSNKESGPNVMRWNNPLNTTMPWAGAVNENSVGVKAYPSVFDGIQATVATLLNGRYPTIVANLRTQLPHHAWGNAAGELNTWGTGSDWLGWQLLPPVLPEEDVMTPDQAKMLQDLHDFLFGSGAGQQGAVKLLQLWAAEFGTNYPEDGKPAQFPHGVGAEILGKIPVTPTNFSFSGTAQAK